MVTVILIRVCLFVACSSRIKVQTLVDFNEVPAEEKLPLVCQITPGVPCMPFSHHYPIAPTISYSSPIISHNNFIPIPSNIKMEEIDAGRKLILYKYIKYF